MTIYSFRTALQAPQEHFRTIGDVVWHEEPITRSMLFAESRVEWRGRNYLLLMPLSLRSMRYIEQFVTAHLHHISRVVPDIMILRDEMIVEDLGGRQEMCDIILESLPEALPMSDAFATARDDSDYAHLLLDSLQRLDMELQRANCSHRNIKIENLLIDSEHNIFPVRWYYATMGYGDDVDALNVLCGEIAAANEVVGERENTYEALAVTTQNYEIHRPLCEGRMAVLTPDGWGFINERGEMVIKPQFRWVGDFYENRAEVTTATGMGLIDREGRFIIEPRYKIVDYNKHSGYSDVETDTGWIRINYIGQIVEPEE